MLWGKSFNPDLEIKDLSGKVILVTGGNTGLGKEAVLQLAKHNPSHIYLAARTPSKGEAAVAAIKEAVPSAQITYLPLDLASFSSVSSAVKAFTDQSKRLDVLMNNAGIMATPPQSTEQGYEIQVSHSCTAREPNLADNYLKFGTNHMGHAVSLLVKLFCLPHGHCKRNGRVGWEPVDSKCLKMLSLPVLLAFPRSDKRWRTRPDAPRVLLAAPDNG